MSSTFKRIASLLTVAAVIAAASAADAGTYPTNKCVASKQKAAAKFCQAALNSWSKYFANPTADPGGTSRDQEIDDAATSLASSWSTAEAKAAAKNAECVETTATATQIDASLRAAVDAVQTTILAGLNDTDTGDRKCGSGILKASASLCSGLLGAESKFMKKQSKDSQRATLAASQQAATDGFQSGYTNSSGDCTSTPPVANDVVNDVTALADDTVEDTVTSPNLPSAFTQVTPATEVEYGKKLLNPRCSQDTPYSFFYRRGTVNKLLMYYQGGGACWNGISCWALPTCKLEANSGDNPDLVGTGFADGTEILNIFKDWHVVFTSYCTCDVHWGENDAFYGSGQTTFHRGRVNAQLTEKFAREHFPNPDAVFVTGSSAGAYGAIMNSTFLMEEVYPAAPFSVLGDAGVGAITKRWLDTNIGNWGLENNFPDFIPGLALPVEDLSAVDLWAYTANNYPQHRFAHYTSAYDGGNGGQTSFFHVMKEGNNVTEWPKWWEHQCEWTDCMREVVTDISSRAPNFRHYVSAGSRHTMYGSDKVYNDATGPVPITIRDWIEAMIDDDVGWVDVDCSSGGDCDPIDTCQGGPNKGLPCTIDADCPGLNGAGDPAECDNDPRPGTLPTAPYNGDGTVTCPVGTCPCYDPMAPNLDDVVCGSE